MILKVDLAVSRMNIGMSCSQAILSTYVVQEGLDAVQEFTEEFQKRNGSVLCRELLGQDISTQEGFLKRPKS